MFRLGTAYSLGQLMEVATAILRALPAALEGTNPKRILAMCAKQGRLLSAVLQESFLRISEGGSVPTSCFIRDLVADGWTITKNVAAPKSIDVSSGLELFTLNREEIILEEYITQASQERKIVLGQRHIEQFLLNQDKAPVELRKYHLIFSGTIWCDPYGDYCVATLFFQGLCWKVEYSYLKLPYSLKNYRIVSPNKFEP